MVHHSNRYKYVSLDVLFLSRNILQQKLQTSRRALNVACRSINKVVVLDRLKWMLRLYAKWKYASSSRRMFAALSSHTSARLWQSRDCEQRRSRMISKPNECGGCFGGAEGVKGICCLFAHFFPIIVFCTPAGAKFVHKTCCTPTKRVRYVCATPKSTKIWWWHCIVMSALERFQWAVR